MQEAKIRNLGPVSISSNDDGMLVESADKLHVELERIKAIAIANIVRLRSYELKETADFVIHSIAWRHGGTARVSCSTTGKIMEFHATGIKVAIEDDVITLDVE